MLRKINALPLFAVFVTLVCSSCNSEKFGPYRLFTNRYDSYEEMLQHLDNLNENIPDDWGGKFYFDFHIDGYDTSYFIEGVDDCLALGLIETFDQHNEERCDYLMYKQIYYELTNDDLVATIKFNYEPSDLTGIYWTSGGSTWDGMIGHSTCLESYCSLETGNGKYEIFNLRFNGCVDSEILTLFQTSLISALEEAI